MHQHSHNEPRANINTAFKAGIVLNLAFVVIEAIAGLFMHSLSLVSDAGHNLADVGSLALSLLAFRLLSVKSNSQFTYGYNKTSILVALVNAVVLLVSVGAMVFEAVQRLFNPRPLAGGAIAVVAAIGIVINASSAFLFMRDKDSDINIRSAYMHLMADAAISFGLVIGGIAMLYTGWFWLDPVLCIGIATTILFSTWKLLRESLRMSLDAVPTEIQLDDVRRAAKTIPGVKEMHHIHIWKISSRENALTAHVVLSQGATIEEEQQVKHKLKHLLEHQHIHHVTLETERENENCAEEEC